jgi:uncharacterized protein (TIGR00730 family)
MTSRRKSKKSTAPQKSAIKKSAALDKSIKSINSALEGVAARTQKIAVLEQKIAHRRISRALRRKHLDERLQSLQHRMRLIEEQLHKLEARFYRVCIFGSARIKPDTKIYNEVAALAHLLAAEGIDILTGGGPGLMEAANKGARAGKEDKKTKSLSYGISIQLEWEPVPNPHLDVKRHHHKFSSRLDDFMRLSHAIICTPGGIGTVLELLFTWQLMQVKHMEPRPIVLLDSGFWNGILAWMREMPLGRKLMNAEDFHHISVVDTPEEVLQIIKPHYEEFLKRKPQLDQASHEF